MARRSNKTSHVLNLLTDPKSSEPSTESSNKLSSPVESSPVENIESVDIVGAMDSATDMAADINPTPAKPKRSSSHKEPTSAAASNATPPIETLVDTSQTLEDRISQQIQASLSAQLAEEEAEDALRAEQDRKIAERIAAQSGIILSNEQEEPEQEEGTSTPAQEFPDVQTASITESEHKYDFELVNVMEAILDEFQTEFMEKLNMCTCHRCWLDTRALTLSSLSGKYVVLERDSIEPMLNFYNHRYRGTIMAQLTKACMAVMANPHH